MNIVKVTLVLNALILFVQHSISFCPPLVAPLTTRLRCTNPVRNQDLNCSTSWLPHGTVAHFTCYNNHTSKLSSGRIFCFEDEIFWGNVTFPESRKSRSSSDDQTLPCGISKDVEKAEVHVYSYHKPNRYNLTGLNRGQDFRSFGEALHNEFRRQHGSPPLQLQENLSSLSQAWADKVARTGKLDMSSGYPFGQNIFLAATNNVTRAVNDAIKNWYYSGSSEYDWEDVTANWGKALALDFAQMVWANSIFLGIGGSVMKRSNMTVVVALYSPGGNVVIDGEEGGSIKLFRFNVVPAFNANMRKASH